MDIAKKTSNDLAEERTELAEERTDMAHFRTLMAADRSMMAWIRTGLAMMSFGFTIYKFMEGMKESASGSKIPEQSPRNMGIFLTMMGMISIGVGVYEYWLEITELRKTIKIRTWRGSLIIAAVMAMLGLFLFVSICIQVI